MGGMGERGMGGVTETGEWGVITSYRDLRIWQLGVGLVEEVYRATRAFPRSELFALTSQMQRAAVSVPANIAEGQVRGYAGEYLHHLAIAHGSLAELLTHIEIARRLGYLPDTQATALAGKAESLSRQINALRAALGTKYPRSTAAAAPPASPLPHPTHPSSPIPHP